MRQRSESLWPNALQVAVCGWIDGDLFAPVLHILQGSGHVLDRHTFSDADDEVDSGSGGLQDSPSGESGRHINGRGVGSGLEYRLFHGIEDGHGLAIGPVEELTTFPGGDTSHHLGSIFHHLTSVERPVPSRDPLDHEARVFIYEDSHETGLSFSRVPVITPGWPGLRLALLLRPSR